MNKRNSLSGLRLTGVVLGLLLAGTACKHDSPAQPPARSVSDMAGHTVAVPPPQAITRVGCLEVLCYEKMFLLGAVDKVAVMYLTNAPWMQQTNPDVARIPKIVGEVNAEDILRRRIDVAFRTASYPSPKQMDQLTALGVPTLISQPQALDVPDSVKTFTESRKRMMRLYGTVLGGEAAHRAEDWCRYYDAQVARVLARTATLTPDQRPKVYYLRGPGPLTTQGRTSNTFWYGEMAGAEMVVKRHASMGKGAISLEELLKWDPDVIIVGRSYSARLVTDDPRWRDLKAVRTHRVWELPEGVFYWDGSSEGVLLMLYLAKRLHPALFPEIDPGQEIRAYYARFYRYRLNDAELALMLEGKGSDGRRENGMNN